jgi:hypothetical protein
MMGRQNTVVLFQLKVVLWQLTIVRPRIKVFPAKHGCSVTTHDASETTQRDFVTAQSCFAPDQSCFAACDGVKVACCLKNRPGCPASGQKQGEKPVKQAARQIPKGWHQSARCGPMTCGDAGRAGPNEKNPERVVSLPAISASA